MSTCAFLTNAAITACCAVQEVAGGIHNAAKAYLPSDPLHSGLLWLDGAVTTCLTSLRLSLQLWEEQQVLMASPGWQGWQQHLSGLQQVVGELEGQLQALVGCSLSPVATTDATLQHLEDVLLVCLVHAPEEATPGSLQWHVLQLEEASEPLLAPAAANLRAMHQLATLLSLACCRLLKAQDPAASSSNRCTALARHCEQLVQQLGLQQQAAGLPAEASELRQLIKRLAVQVPYAAAALTNTPWLLAQCSAGVVMGPVALLQGWQAQLLAPGRAYASASYLALRVLDCIEDIRSSLFTQDESVLTEGAVAAAHLTGPEVAAVCDMVEKVGRLLVAPITVSVAGALTSSSAASRQLDGLKAAVVAACDQLQQGRPQLEGWCDRLKVRSELLQKEVLKAETQRVLAAYTQAVADGHARHQQQLDALQSQLWRPAEDGKPALEGLAPDLAVLQLWDVCDLPALFQVLAAGAPPGVQAQLQPTSPLVLQWFGQQRITEACLRHGILSQGDLMRSIYDFCLQVLRVAGLLEECRATAAGALQLLEQPQAAVLAAYSTISANGSNSSSTPECLGILDKLQHMQGWALEQVTTVVLSELGHMQQTLEAATSSSCSSAAGQLHEVWMEACTELVQQRKEARRSWWQKRWNKVRNSSTLCSASLIHARTLTSCTSAVWDTYPHIPKHLSVCWPLSQVYMVHACSGHIGCSSTVVSNIHDCHATASGYHKVCLRCPDIHVAAELRCFSGRPPRRSGSTRRLQRRR